MKACSILCPRVQAFLVPSSEQTQACLVIKRRLVRQLEQLVCTQGFDVFLCSAEQGVELWAAEAVLELKKDYPQVRLCHLRPPQAAMARWSQAQQKRYEQVAAQSEAWELPASENGLGRARHKISYMIQNSSALLAIWEGQKSDCAWGVNQALQQGKRVIWFHPTSLAVELL